MSSNRPMFLRFTIAFMLSIVSLATPAWADFQAGMDAYAHGDCATAMREWRPLAEQERRRLIMATAVHSIDTNFGPTTTSSSGSGQLLIHTIANWMWVPMIMMGVMAIATAIGLGIAQANVGSDLGK